MTEISPIDFKPELVSMMKSVLEKASAYIDNASDKPAKSVTKAKMASRILATVADLGTRSRLRKVSAGRLEATVLKVGRAQIVRPPATAYVNPRSGGAYFIAVGVEGIQEA